MKKTLALLLALTMVFALAACGSTQTTPAPEATEAPAAETPTEEPAAEAAVGSPVDLIWASQGAGTTSYTSTAAEINIFLKYLPEGSKITQETISSGSSSSGYLLEAGLCDIAGGENAAAATVGLDGRPPYEHVRALYGTKTRDFVMMITTKKFNDKTGYTSIREILENKYPCTICCEDVGSSDYTCLLYTFDILGYTFEEFESWGGRIVTTSGSACCEMLQDNQADIMIGHCSTESSSIVELGMSTDVIMTSIDEEIIEGFKERGFGSAVIPAGAFNGRFTKDTPSAAIGASHIVLDTMDEDTAYMLTKIAVEHLDEFAEEVASFQDLTPEEMADTSVTVVPLHPGAIRYYKEIGVL